MNPVRAASAAGATGETVRPAYSDEETQEALVDWLEAQEYWKRNDGRDHVLVASDPNALFKVIDKIKNSVLLVCDFGRLRPDQGSLIKDLIVPYSHRVNTYTGQIGVENRNTLLFFMGNRYRKEVIHIILSHCFLYDDLCCWCFAWSHFSIWFVGLLVFFMLAIYFVTTYLQFPIVTLERWIVAST